MAMHETVLRYEGPPRKKESGQAEQKMRLQNEKFRELTDYIRVLDEEQGQMEWTRRREASELKAFKKQTSHIKTQCQGEARQWAKAAMMVRRRALQVQLQTERAQCTAELASMGKAFHSERL